MKGVGFLEIELGCKQPLWLISSGKVHLSQIERFIIFLLGKFHFIFFELVAGLGMRHKDFN